jgi:hypothetical protein
MLKLTTNWDVFKSMLLSSRFKGFYWFLGSAVLSTFINALIANIDMFAPYVSPATIILLTGILQQFSKAIANVMAGKDTGFIAK